MPGFSYETYEYILTVLTESLLGFLSAGIIAWWMEIFSEAAVFLGTFFLLRSYAGGFHFKRFISCYIGSIGIIIVAFSIIKFCDISKTVSCILLMIAMAVLLAVKPGNNRNRPVDANESIHFKKKLIKMLLAVSTIYSFFMACSLYRYAAAIMVAVVAVSALMIMGKWKNT